MIGNQWEQGKPGSYFFSANTMASEEPAAPSIMEGTAGDKGNLKPEGEADTPHSWVGFTLTGKWFIKAI